MGRIVFMGTPEFAVPALKTLIETQDVAGVVTQPDRAAGRGRRLQAPPVKEAALAAGLPVYQPKSLRREEAAAPLWEWRPDMIVVAAFGQILRPHVLDLPPLGCLNVHASLLPRWRGAAPIQYAIRNGDAETGITLMQMDPGLDTGPTFVQQAIAIRPRETAASLHDRLAILGGKMLLTYLDDILEGRLSPTPQDGERATYAPTIKKEEGLLDWQQTAVALDRHVRAMTPWPGAFTTWSGKRLRILSAHPVVTSPAGGEPGTVVKSEDDIVVLAGSGYLALETVQLAGKTAVAAKDFVNGQPDFVGSKLG